MRLYKFCIFIQETMKTRERKSEKHFCIYLQVWRSFNLVFLCCVAVSSFCYFIAILVLNFSPCLVIFVIHSILQCLWMREVQLQAWGKRKGKNLGFLNENLQTESKLRLFTYFVFKLFFLQHKKVKPPLYLFNFC